jgi:hypothetical protein
MYYRTIRSLIFHPYTFFLLCFADRHCGSACLQQPLFFTEWLFVLGQPGNAGATATRPKQISNDTSPYGRGGPPQEKTSGASLNPNHLGVEICCTVQTKLVSPILTMQNPELANYGCS